MRLDLVCSHRSNVACTGRLGGAPLDNQIWPSNRRGPQMPAAKRKAKRVGDLALWLAEHEGLALTDLHDGFCRELLTRGVPLWRSSLGLELLHPEQSGVR